MGFWSESGPTRFGSEREPSEPSPLATCIDPYRFGAAVLVTSACRAFIDLDLEEPNPGVNCDAQGQPLLLVHGGPYRHETRDAYRQHALNGVALVTQTLEDLGVPPSRIHHQDYCDGCGDADPAGDVRYFLARLPENMPDALVYYIGPSTADGLCRLGWRGLAGELRGAALDPDDFFPRAENDVPGERLLIGDAPFTARRWLRPAPRRRGVAAWQDGALASTEMGPAMARWIAGQFPAVPSGALTFPATPPNAGLARLPMYRKLFWSSLPNAQTAGTLIWELEGFLGAPTQQERRMAANAELLARGGAAVMLALLTAHGATADDAVILQIFWVLHILVLSTVLERWVGTMDDVARCVLAIPSRRAPCSTSVLSAALSLIAACCSRCTQCRAEFACRGAADVIALVLQALGDDGGDNGHIEGPTRADAATAAAGCRLAAQVTSSKPLDADNDARVLAALQMLLCRDAQAGDPDAVDAENELVSAAAEALVFACMHSNAVKLTVLRTLGRSGRLAAAVEGASAPATVGRLFNLLRALASAEPIAAVREAFVPEVAAMVVRSLNRFPEDRDVQRWGLASLGALATGDGVYAQHVGEGGLSCASRTLRVDALADVMHVQQEALFCVHSMLPACRECLKDGGRELAGIVGDSVSRGLRQGAAGVECTAWGLRVYERLCASRRGPSALTPFANIIVEAMVSPFLCPAAAEAGSAAASLMAGGSPTAKQRLAPHRATLAKALSELAWRTGEAHGRGCKEERELQEWAKVLMELLGEFKPHVDDGDEFMDNHMSMKAAETEKALAQALQEKQGDKEDWKKRRSSAV